MKVGKRLAIIRFNSRNGVGIAFAEKGGIMLRQIISAPFFKLLKLDCP